MQLFPALVLTLVLVLMVVNKVGSPQFSSWLAAPIILGLTLEASKWRVPAVLGLIIAGLTQLVYPYFYRSLLMADPWLVGVLTLRNGLEIVLLCWALQQIWSYSGQTLVPEPPQRAVAEAAQGTTQSRPAS